MSRLNRLHQLLPTRVHQLSALVHVGAVGAFAVPGVWPWALGAVAADHALVCACGLWPRSRWLGPNVTRLPASARARREVAVTIDDGPDPEVTPRVLDQLEAHGARATFFCIGERVARHPQLAVEIIRRGHSIENHSDRHRRCFSVLGPRALAGEIGRAQQRITAVCGAAPKFFRAPAGLRNVWLEPVLAHMGLTLATWTRRGFDTVRTDPHDVLARLCRNLAAGDILLLHDGHSARTVGGTPVVLDVLPQLLQALTSAKLKTVTLGAAIAAAEST